MAKGSMREYVTELLVGVVRVYQLILSPLIGPCCRFYPSCSHYTIAALRKYGPLKGVWYGVKRIARCHPWNAGGYDPLR